MKSAVKIPPETPPKKLVCDICGAGSSKSGKPFDGSSLAKHMTMVHRAERNPSPESGELTCDICGVNQSSRGKKFTLVSHVLQHKKKRHPEGENHSPGSTAPIPSKATRMAKQPGRRGRAVAPTSAPGTSHVKFCPHCGFNLAVVHAAMEFVNGDTHS